MKRILFFCLLALTLSANARTPLREETRTTPERESSQPMFVMHPTFTTKAIAPGEMQYVFRDGTVELDWESLRSVAQLPSEERGDVIVEVFPGEYFQLDGQSIRFAPHDGTTIMAGLKDGESGTFIMSFAGLNAYGMFEAGFRRFLFKSIAGSTFGTLRVGEVDHSAFPGCYASVDKNPTHDVEREEPSPIPKAQPSPTTVVEGAVLYSPAVETRQGGDPAAFINTLAATVNAAFSNSSVSASYRVVQYRLVNFTEPSLISHSGLQDYVENIYDEASPLADVEGSRTNYRSDLVAVLVDGSKIGAGGSDFAACGTAHIPSGSGTPKLAAAALSDGCAAGDLTFAHETSHTMGGRHDYVDDDNAGFGGLNHGYSNTSVTFRTVMGQRPNGAGQACTFAGGCPRLTRYSTPNQSATVSGNSYALGVTDDDPGEPGNQTPDMVSTLANSVPVVVLNRTSGDAAPSQPASMTVDRLCSGNNELSWPTPSGTVGWYEVQSSTSSGYSPTVDEYRGGQLSLIINVAGTRWVRVRSCNAEGCSSWRNGSQTATTTCP